MAMDLNFDLALGIDIQIDHKGLLWIAEVQHMFILKIKTGFQWPHTEFFFLWIYVENDSIFSKPKSSTATISCHMVVEIMRAFS